MKKLAGFFKGFIKESVLGPLFKLLEASLELIVPLIIADLIDNGIKSGGGDGTYIIRSSLILVALGAIGLGFSVTAQYFAARAACGVTTGMKNALYRHIQTLSYSEIDAIGPSTLISRLTSDSNQVQNGINLTLRLLLRSPFVVFGAMIMAFTIDKRAALTFVVVIPLLSVVVFGIMLGSMPLYKATQTRLDGVLSRTRDALSGARVIRAFCKENDEIQNFKEANDSLTAMQKLVGKISALMNPLTYILINFAIIFLIYIGALRVDIGDLSQGEVVALYNYMCQILVELVKLANLIISITKALASAARIRNVFDTESSMKYGTSVFTGVGSGIVFNNVSLRYNGAGDNSLASVSFTAERGSTIGIIGGTGSGKSSLVNLIPRFYDATDGSITIDGRPISDYTKDSLREKIGIVPQKAVLFSGSIRDNMRWGNKDATDSDILNAIEIAQGASIVEDKGGLDAYIEQGGRNLSGGQRQRLTIARALVKKPDILILDDSASALDYATDANLRSAISRSTDDMTVFIVSQRTSSVMSADKIIVLDDGEVIAIGAHEELLESCSVYKEIYETQFGKEDGANA
ncbi:MAG: ABC transporter ATP-binding protein [Ruminococcaceae bacterium]|nr:ABC transporter ATP-binding protein [Oscillospiraceae bacterium]